MALQSKEELEKPIDLTGLTAYWTGFNVGQEFLFQVSSHMRVSNYSFLQSEWKVLMRPMQVIDFVEEQA